MNTNEISGKLASCAQAIKYAQVALERGDAREIERCATFVWREMYNLMPRPTNIIEIEPKEECAVCHT